MRLCGALLFVCLLAVTGVTGDAQTLPTADELLASAKAALGTAPENYRETITSSGSLGTSTSTRYTLGKDFMRVNERGGLRGKSGEYKGDAWHQTSNGLTVIDEPDPGNEADEKTTTTVRRVSTPYDAYVLEEFNIHKMGTRTYYDPATYRVLRSEELGPEGTTVTVNEEFAQFGKRTLPKRWTVTSAASKLEQHYVRADYVEGAVIPAQVEIPGSRRTLVEFPPGVTTVKLPTQFIHDDIMVRLNIGPRAVDFILDSGAAGIFMDRGLATDLGLTLINSASVVTAQRYIRSNAIVPEIRIGDVRMHDIVVSVGPMPGVHPDGAKPVGLLGFDFLAQLGVTIDYEKQTVTVTPAENFVAPRELGSTEFDIRLGDQVPELSVQVENAVADHMVLDTGWNGTMGFFDYFTRRYPQAFRFDLGPAGAYGVGGPFAAELFRMPKIGIGPFAFKDFAAMRIGPGSFNFDGDGAIGSELLSHFTFRLDYTNGRIFLTPNHKP